MVGGGYVAWVFYDRCGRGMFFCSDIGFVTPFSQQIIRLLLIHFLNKLFGDLFKVVISGGLGCHFIALSLASV